MPRQPSGNPPQVREWTETQVRAWVETCTDAKLSVYGEAFESHNIDGATLLGLCESDLREPPLSIGKLGDIKRLHAAIRTLQAEAGVVMSGRRREPSIRRRSTTPDGGHEDDDESDHTETRCSEPEQRRRDLIRLAFASAYCLVSVFATSFSLVAAHERVPLTDEYPPLPDVVLDNFPLVPWAFAASEYAIFSLAAVLFAIIATHRARVVILTRILAIAATVFLLRCVTMLATSLSVPGAHLSCPPLRLNSWEEKMERVMKIVLGLGSTVLGVETCGDYMFSGHCVGLTLAACFICEYTPSHWVSFHRIVWVSALSGMFCILLAHEHYSIDVFVGFYISSRVFAYHHTLVSAMSTMSRRQVHKMHMWFPLVSFFERDRPQDPHSLANAYDIPQFLRKL